MVAGVLISVAGHEPSLRFGGAAGGWRIGVGIRKLRSEGEIVGTKLEVGTTVGGCGSGAAWPMPYQLAFFTPGMRPRLARLRKQIRQMPNLR